MPQPIACADLAPGQRVRFSYTNRYAGSTVTGIFIEHEHSTGGNLAASIRDERDNWPSRCWEIDGVFELLETTP